VPSYKTIDEIPDSMPREKMNLFMAINNALEIVLRTDDSSLLFGEDVKFGGVFRCSLDLN
jgi:2-oxoisovalerate dehydrogenase E1 component beta subunit